MSETTLERPDVAAYVAAVRAELADLPAAERDDLLADVEASLVDSGEPPLLPPAEFAAELRDAAGLEPGTPAAAAAPSLRDSLRDWLASERVAAALATARELAPIWWLARAYVAVAVVALAAGWGWPVGTGAASYTLSIETSVLVLVLATVASVWLGLRGRRRGTTYPRVALAVNAALALALLPVATQSFDQLYAARTSEIVSYPEAVPGLAYDGAQIRNLYPYSRDGEPLFDVLLYDESGRPLDIGAGSEDASRRVLTGADGTQLFNSFPIRYFEPGTTTVAQPELGPPVELPSVTTPTLERP